MSILPNLSKFQKTSSSMMFESSITTPNIINGEEKAPWNSVESVIYVPSKAVRIPAKSF